MNLISITLRDTIFLLLVRGGRIIKKYQKIMKQDVRYLQQSECY